MASRLRQVSCQSKSCVYFRLPSIVVTHRCLRQARALRRRWRVAWPLSIACSSARLVGSRPVSGFSRTQSAVSVIFRGDVGLQLGALDPPLAPPTDLDRGQLTAADHVVDLRQGHRQLLGDIARVAGTERPLLQFAIDCLRLARRCCGGRVTARRVRRVRVYEQFAGDIDPAAADPSVDDQLIRVYLPATLSMLAPLRRPARPAPRPARRPGRARGHAAAARVVRRGRRGGTGVRRVHPRRPGGAAVAARRSEGAPPPGGDLRRRRRRKRSRSREPELGSSLVRLAGPLPFGAVAAVHVDGAGAEPDVSRGGRRGRARRSPATRTRSSPSTAPRITNWSGTT